MALKTIKVVTRWRQHDGSPLVGKTVSAELTVPEIDEGIVVPVRVKMDTDENGVAILNLWPNERGQHGSKYQVTCGTTYFFITVPDGDADQEYPMELFINQAPYPSLSATEALLAQVQAIATRLQVGPSMLPTAIGQGETFAIPEGYQAAFFIPPTIDGDVLIDGDFVEV
jgi:hypothetical protein